MTMTVRRQLPIFLFFSVASIALSKEYDDPTFLFDFQKTKFENDTVSSLGSLSSFLLSRNVSNTKFSMGDVGLESVPESPQQDEKVLYGPIQPLLSLYQNDTNPVSGGLSLSFWFRSLATQQEHVPLLTVGSGMPVPSASLYALTECDRRQIDLQVTLENTTLALLYRTSDTFFEPCQRILLDRFDVENDALVHIAIVLADRHQQVFINGESSILMKEPFEPDLSHWNGIGFLHFFSYWDSPVWKGRLYRFAAFMDTLGHEDVLSVLARGLPPAHPCAISMTYRINEDAELIGGSHSAEWYEHPNNYSPEYSDEVPNLVLPIEFLDEDVQEIILEQGINQTSSPELFVFISGFPSHGTLYAVDGTMLSSSGTSSDLILLEHRSVVFVPRHNTYSTMPGSIYTTLEFCVALRPIFGRLGCLSTANISIIVDRVNDPPVPVIASAQPYQVHEGIVEEIFPLHLLGYDVDQGDRISTFEIISPPQRGFLLLSVPVRRKDGLLHGTLLSELNYTVPGSDAFIEYRHNNGKTIIRDQVVRDSFDFRVRDSHGIWSLPAKVTIQVNSAVFALPAMESALVYEGTFVTLPLRGEDRSGLDRAVGFFLEYVPNRSDGIAQNMNGEFLLAGSVLDDVQVLPPYQEEAGIRFKPTEAFCHEGTRMNTSFDYRAVAFDANGQISSVSAVSSQYLSVLCRINPIGLIMPQGHFSTQAMGSDSAMNDPCSGYRYNGSDIDEELCQSALILDGIVVTSDDSHTERASVTLRSSHGRLTISKKYRSALRLLENQAVMRPSIEFMAELTEITEILTHLHFQSEVVGPDQIQISILYGNCTSNAFEQDHHFECIAIENSLDVEVLPEQIAEQDILFGEFPWAPLPFTFTMLLLIKLKGKMRILLALNEDKDNSRDEDTTIADTTDVHWQQFYDEASGFFYYLNLDDRSVTWDPPLEEQFITWEEAEDGVVT